MRPGYVLHKQLDVQFVTMSSAGFNPVKNVPETFRLMEWPRTCPARTDLSTGIFVPQTSLDRTAMLLLSPLLTSHHQTDTRSLPFAFTSGTFLFTGNVFKNLIFSWRAALTKCTGSNSHRHIIVELCNFFLVDWLVIIMSSEMWSDGAHLHLAVDMQLLPETSQNCQHQFVLTVVFWLRLVFALKFV